MTDGSYFYVHIWNIGISSRIYIYVWFRTCICNGYIWTLFAFFSCGRSSINDSLTMHSRAKRIKMDLMRGITEQKPDIFLHFAVLWYT